MDDKVENSEEREVWIDGRKIRSKFQIICPITLSSKDIDGCFDWDICDMNCAAFRIQNGYAKCQMTHGDQIIGKIIEKPEE